MTGPLEDIDFPPADETAWRAKLAAGPKGACLEALVSTAEDGFRYGPVHPRFSPARPIGRLNAAPPALSQRLDDPDAVRANAQALADLEGGADALSLVLADAPCAHGFGLPPTEAAIRTALGGVRLPLVALRIEPHPRAGLAVAAVRRIAADAGHRLEDLAIDLCLDPIGPAAVAGRFPEDDPDGRAASRRIADAVEAGGRGRVVEADGRPYHEAGASAAGELGAVLATAVHHLRTLEEAGLGRVAGAIGFTLAMDQKLFPGIAKVRALRLLWRRVLELCGVEAPPAARLHVETSFRMMAAGDPPTNILRTTIANFAAVAGSADSVSVLPHTVANGLPERRARRLARNGQLILREEAGLGRVADPAAGSGGIEALTDGLCEAAWAEMQRIEAEGGLPASLRAGALQGRIAQTRDARRRRIADGTEAIVGVTLHPPEHEGPVAVLMRRVTACEEPAAEGGFPPLRPQALAAAGESPR